VDSRVGLPKGTVLDGSYRIARIVGAGGFGITYEAEDINLNTTVALKEYFPFDFGDRDSTMSVRPKSERHLATFEWGRSNFLSEARTLARFEHPSIVRVTRVFEANATAYMVMRFERGQSFESWLTSLGRPPTQEELDRIADFLLDALELMHAANFLHRDIAPDNVIIRPDGSPVLLDFGSARRAVAERSRLLTGIVKAGFSPHEQYASDSRLQGPWSDLYALGGTFYKAVTGRAPEEATLRAIDDHMPPAARSAAGDYRPGFLRAIDACLRVIPSARPQSVAQLRRMMLVEKRETTRPLTAFSGVLANRLQNLQRSWQPRVQGVTLNKSLGIATAALVALGGGIAVVAYANMQSGGHDTPDSEVQRLLAQAELRQKNKKLASLEEVKRRSEEARLAEEKRAAEERARQEEAKRQAEAAARKKAEKEALAKRQEEERIAAAQRAAEERARQEEAKRQTEAAARKKAEEEALAKRQEEERIAAAQRAAEERARQEEAKRLAEAAAKKKAEEEALAKRQEEEHIAAAKRAAEERARQEEAKRQAEAAAKKKAEEAALAKRQEEERIAAAAKRAAEERGRQEEAKRQAEAAAKKKAEEAALAKRQEEERIAASAKRAAEERARQEEAKRQAEAAATKKAEEAALAKRQEEERIAAEAKRAAEERARQEEAKRQAEAAAKKKAEDEALAKRQDEERIAATKRAAEEQARQEEGKRQAEATNAKGGDESTRVAVVTLNAEERATFVKRVQRALKHSECYDGAINGNSDETQKGLDRYLSQARHKGKEAPARIEVAKATAADFDTWLRDADDLKGRICRLEKPAHERSSDRPARERSPERSARERSPDRSARARQPSYSSGRGGGGGGGGGAPIQGVR
jgi:serine/threonine protein kinase